MLQKGTELGGYEIIEQVGMGGMATVYKAHHARLDRYVAIKVMHQTLAQEENFHARFEREARIIARLDHANIVSIYDFSEYEGNPYLVMKYVEGETLEDRLEDQKLSLNEVARVLRPVAEALAYAHGQNILHRDVKPSNIILGTNGTVYLTDFGLARLAASGSSTMSQGAMIGTPHYISPEQALGNKTLDARTDVYSLGVVLYELVVGRVPYAGDTPFSIVHDHIYSPLPAPSTINAAVSPAVEAVLVRAMAKDPADRFQTTLALIEAFEAAIADGDAPAVPTAQRREPAPVPPPVVPPPVVTNARARRRDDNRERREQRRTSRRGRKEFEFNFGDIDFEDLGEAIEEKVESWGEAIEEWAEQFEDGIEGVTSGKRRRRHKAPLTPEEQIRRRIEKRHKELNEFRTHVVIYLMINLLFYFIWLGLGFMRQVPWPLFVTFGWGIGVVANYLEYNHKYGRAAERREQEIQREVERARMRGEIPAQEDYAKRKNEDLAEYEEPPVRLTDDGELTDSFVQDWMAEDKPKRRGRN